MKPFKKITINLDSELDAKGKKVTKEDSREKYYKARNHKKINQNKVMP